jgi:hypothetical protein
MLTRNKSAVINFGDIFLNFARYTTHPSDFCSKCERTHPTAHSTIGPRTLDIVTKCFQNSLLLAPKHFSAVIIPHHLQQVYSPSSNAPKKVMHDTYSMW